MKYSTPADAVDWPSRLPANATDDERQLATFGVQFENGDLPRESVAALLNLCADLLGRARVANEALTEAGFEAERDEYQDAARRLAGVVDVNNGKINEANARAEKYLAVIKAKDAELVAVHRCWVAAIKSAEAMTAAGMVIDAFVQSEQEDADHD